MDIESKLEKNKIKWNIILARYELVKKARALRKPKRKKVLPRRSTHPVLLIPNKSILKKKIGIKSFVQRFYKSPTQTRLKINNFFLAAHKYKPNRFLIVDKKQAALAKYTRQLDLSTKYFTLLDCKKNTDWQKFSFSWSTRLNIKMSQIFYKNYYLKNNLQKPSIEGLKKKRNEIQDKTETNIHQTNLLKDDIKRRQANKVAVSHSHTKIFQQVIKEIKPQHPHTTTWHEAKTKQQARKLPSFVINISTTNQEKTSDTKIETKKVSALVKRQFLEAGGWGNRRVVKLSAHEKKRRRKELQLWKFGSQAQRIVCKQQRQEHFNNIERRNEYISSKKHNTQQRNENTLSTARVYNTHYFKKTKHSDAFLTPPCNYTNQNQNPKNYNFHKNTPWPNNAQKISVKKTNK